MISLVVILFLGTIGLGYAAWNDMLNVEGTVLTGYIEPVFSEPHLSLKEGHGQGQVLLSGRGERLLVYIKDAHPGDVYYLDFKVINEGTIPVKAEALVVTSGDALDIELFDEQISMIEGQNVKDGGIRIKVQQTAEDGDCAFMVRLTFCQSAVL